MSQLPKQHSTSKLFYRKYLYKIELCNNLNNIFRSENQKNKNLDYARDRLDEFASNYRNGQPLIQNFFRTSREVPMEHYLDAKNLYLILKNENDFTIRVENGSSVSKMSSKEIKRDLLVFARNNPALFLELASDDNVQLRNFGIKATELGIIKLTQDQRNFLWGSNDRVIMTIPFDEHPYTALAAWFKTDEGMEIYKNIEKRLN